MVSMVDNTFALVNGFVVNLCFFWEVGPPRHVANSHLLDVTQPRCVYTQIVPEIQVASSS